MTIMIVGETRTQRREKPNRSEPTRLVMHGKESSFETDVVKSRRVVFVIVIEKKGMEIEVNLKNEFE